MVHYTSSVDRKILKQVSRLKKAHVEEVIIKMRLKGSKNKGRWRWDRKWRRNREVGFHQAEGKEWV